jgi:hypothetical protein
MQTQPQAIPNPKSKKQLKANPPIFCCSIRLFYYYQTNTNSIEWLNIGHLHIQLTQAFFSAFFCNLSKVADYCRGSSSCCQVCILLHMHTRICQKDEAQKHE